MTRALLITNPVAARTTDRTLGRIERIFRDAGWDIEVRVTTGHGDANRFAHEGLANGVEVVTVFGGGMLVRVVAKPNIKRRGPDQTQQAKHDEGPAPANRLDQVSLVIGALEVPADPVKGVRHAARGTGRQVNSLCCLLRRGTGGDETRGGGHSRAAATAVE